MCCGDAYVSTLLQGCAEGLNNTHVACALYFLVQTCRKVTCIQDIRCGQQVWCFESPEEGKVC